MVGIERAVIVRAIRVASAAVQPSSRSTTDERDRVPTTTTAVLPQSTRSAAAGRGSENGGLVRGPLGFRRSVAASPQRADDDKQEERDEAPRDDDADVLCEIGAIHRRSEGSPDTSSSRETVGVGDGTHHAGVLTLPPISDDSFRQFARTDALFDSLGLAVGDDH